MSIVTNTTQHAHGPTRARSCLDRGALPAIGRGGPGRWRLLLCLFGLIDRLVPLFRLMLATGLRRGEALGLHWRDVHLDARMLRVRWTLTRTSRRPGTRRAQDGQVPADRPPPPLGRRDAPGASRPAGGRAA